MKYPTVYIVFHEDNGEARPYDGRAYLSRDSALFVLSHVSPRLGPAEVVEYEARLPKEKP